MQSGYPPGSFLDEKDLQKARRVLIDLRQTFAWQADIANKGNDELLMASAREAFGLGNMPAETNARVLLFGRRGIDWAQLNPKIDAAWNFALELGTKIGMLTQQEVDAASTMMRNIKLMEKGVKPVDETRFAQDTAQYSTLLLKRHALGVPILDEQSQIATELHKSITGDLDGILGMMPELTKSIRAGASLVEIDRQVTETIADRYFGGARDISINPAEIATALARAQSFKNPSAYERLYEMAENKTLLPEPNVGTMGSQFTAQPAGIMAMAKKQTKHAKAGEGKARKGGQEEEGQQSKRRTGVENPVETYKKVVSEADIGNFSDAKALVFCNPKDKIEGLELGVEEKRAIIEYLDLIAREQSERARQTSAAGVAALAQAATGAIPFVSSFATPETRAAASFFIDWGIRAAVAYAETGRVEIAETVAKRSYNAASFSEERIAKQKFEKLKADAVLAIGSKKNKEEAPTAIPSKMWAGLVKDVFLPKYEEPSKEEIDQAMRDAENIVKTQTVGMRDANAQVVEAKIHAEYIETMAARLKYVGDYIEEYAKEKRGEAVILSDNQEFVPLRQDEINGLQQKVAQIKGLPYDVKLPSDLKRSINDAEEKIRDYRNKLETLSNAKDMDVETRKFFDYIDQDSRLPAQERKNPELFLPAGMLFEEFIGENSNYEATMFRRIGGSTTLTETEKKAFYLTANCIRDMHIKRITEIAAYNKVLIQNYNGNSELDSYNNQTKTAIDLLNKEIARELGDEYFEKEKMDVFDPDDESEYSFAREAKLLAQYSASLLKPNLVGLYFQHEMLSVRGQKMAAIEPIANIFENTADVTVEDIAKAYNQALEKQRQVEKVFDTGFKINGSEESKADNARALLALDLIDSELVKIINPDGVRGFEIKDGVQMVSEEADRDMRARVDEARGRVRATSDLLKGLSCFGQIEDGKNGVFKKENLKDVVFTEKTLEKIRERAKGNIEKFRAFQFVGKKEQEAEINVLDYIADREKRVMTATSVNNEPSGDNRATANVLSTGISKLLMTCNMWGNIIEAVFGLSDVLLPELMSITDKSEETIRKEILAAAYEEKCVLAEEWAPARKIQLNIAAYALIMFLNQVYISHARWANMSTMEKAKRTTVKYFVEYAGTAFSAGIMAAGGYVASSLVATYLLPAGGLLPSAVIGAATVALPALGYYSKPGLTIRNAARMAGMVLQGFFFASGIAAIGRIADLLAPNQLGYQLVAFSARATIGKVVSSALRPVISGIANAITPCDYTDINEKELYDRIRDPAKNQNITYNSLVTRRNGRFLAALSTGFLQASANKATSVAAAVATDVTFSTALSVASVAPNTDAKNQIEMLRRYSDPSYNANQDLFDQMLITAHQIDAGIANVTAGMGIMRNFSLASAFLGAGLHAHYGAFVLSFFIQIIKNLFPGIGEQKTTQEKTIQVVGYAQREIEQLKEDEKRSFAAAISAGKTPEQIASDTKIVAKRNLIKQKEAAFMKLKMDVTRKNGLIENFLNQANYVIANAAANPQIVLNLVGETFTGQAFGMVLFLIGAQVVRNISSYLTLALAEVKRKFADRTFTNKILEFGVNTIASVLQVTTTATIGVAADYATQGIIAASAKALTKAPSFLTVVTPAVATLFNTLQVAEKISPTAILLATITFFGDLVLGIKKSPNKEQETENTDAYVRAIYEQSQFERQSGSNVSAGKSLGLLDPNDNKKLALSRVLANLPEIYNLQKLQERMRAAMKCTNRPNEKRMAIVKLAVELRKALNTDMQNFQIGILASILIEQSLSSEELKAQLGSASTIARVLEKKNSAVIVSATLLRLREFMPTFSAFIMEFNNAKLFIVENK